MNVQDAVIEKITSSCSLQSKTYISHSKEKNLLVGVITADTGLMSINFSFSSNIYQSEDRFEDIDICINLSQEKLIKDSFMKNKIYEVLGVNASNSDLFYILEHLKKFQESIKSQMIKVIKTDFENHTFEA
ncbi:MAG: hypothetical protein ACJAS1_003997 [Oleiphilaceae bacterium]|jgi:hypothetical protein